MTDQLVRFIFDSTDIRGEWVQLQEAYRDTLANHHYAPGVRRLVGEFLAAAALLGATLKFEGMLILQARSKGQVPLIMAEATSGGAVRAIVRGAEAAIGEDFRTLIGQGQLTITIDPVGGQRYQGIVGMNADSLAGCLEDYFRQSEQLPTRLWLAADDRTAAGMLLQELPSNTDPQRRQQQWQHLVALSDTISHSELLTLSATDLLRRLFHQESLRLLREDAIHFQCSCSRARTEAMLRSLGRNEIESIISEQGSIFVNCEFCLQNYHFSPEQALSLFAGPGHH